MKISEVMKAIENNHGYLVHFEHYGDGLLRGDYFPDIHGGEEPFETEDEAIAMGIKYAKATKGRTCNFYLVRGDNFTPVGHWNLANR